MSPQVVCVGLATLGVRIDVVNDRAVLQVLTVREHVHADDLPEAREIRTIPADVPMLILGCVSPGSVT